MERGAGGRRGEGRGATDDEAPRSPPRLQEQPGSPGRDRDILRLVNKR